MNSNTANLNKSNIYWDTMPVAPHHIVPEAKGSANGIISMMLATTLL